MVGEESGLDGFGWVVHWLTVFFHSAVSLLFLSSKSQFQLDLDVLTGLFDRVGLHTNVKKPVRMACQPCHIVGGHSEVAYMRWMTGMVPSFQVRHQDIVWFPECDM